MAITQSPLEPGPPRHGLPQQVTTDKDHIDEPAASSKASTPPTEFEEETISSADLERIWDWNTPVPPTIATCMHDYVKQQAQKEPARPAIHSWDGDFTYHDVDHKSDLLASHLVSLGVCQGVNVPLLFEKSRWTSVGVLAVMKAGGTFALMDPSQPEGRLSTIVEQTGASIIMTSEFQAAFGQRIAPGATHVVVAEAQFEKYAMTAGLPVVPPSTNLYIQSTSGSTGKPKGVVITHENFTSGAVPRGEIVGYRPHSRVLDFASYAFDVCIDCMLCTLSVGGCLCIPSEAERVNDLSGAIRRMRINLAAMTPSVARVLEADIIPSLEVLGLGGEAISAGDAAAWSRTTRVINAYGPSECTVGCTVNGDVGAESTNKSHVTIGRGVGASIWIVDPADHDRLVPVGVVGELLVEGPIVGPGYLSEPDKTAAVFINDPKWLLAGSPRHKGRTGRLYKTGDLVRYDQQDGTIIFVGRGDQQVKLRGQRIELAEIEHHMRENLPPETRVVAEVIKPGGGGEPTLVAFVAERAGLVSETDQDLLGSLSTTVQDALGKMNKSLAENLPVYMVPAAYLPLRTMPQLVSAKTDRKRLRELGASLSRKDLAGYAAISVERKEPTTAMEKRLAELWRQVLGGSPSADDDSINAHDNFFAIGGDSLRAMKLVAAARSAGLSLSVADILTHPVLSEMALASKFAASEESAIPEVPPFSLLSTTDWPETAAREECARLCGIDDPAMIDDIYPCTPLQEALMALSAKVSEAYVAQRVVELPSARAAHKLREAFRVASSSSAILRTRIVQVPGRGLLQVVVKDDFDCSTLTTGDGGGGGVGDAASLMSEYLAADRSKPVELGKPLVRYGVVTDESTTGKSHFALTMHHALYDGWCMPLIVDRVNRAYNSIDSNSNNNNLATTNRPAEFKHFIKFLSDGQREQSASYWRERLQGATAQQFPPLPYKSYQQKADSLLEHYVHVPRRAVTAGTTTTTTTMATAIRGAWALLVSQYMGGSSNDQNDVVFGETLTGRNAPIPGVDEIEGPMIATVPVRVSVDPEASVSEYLQEIHESAVAAIPHEHFGLQHIRRLSPDAWEACELRTGLVLHPSTGGSDVGGRAGAGGSESVSTGLGHVFPFLNGHKSEEEEEEEENTRPADGFVPAGDEEAAQEALKFNTYGLMLVCSLDPDGFLIMASFDSKMVSSAQLEKMLANLGRIVQACCENPGAKVKSLRFVEEDEVEELRRLSRVGAVRLNERAGGLALGGSDGADENIKISTTWIVESSDLQRLVPVGAVGELLVQCDAVGDAALAPSLEAVQQRPQWLLDDNDNNSTTGKLFRTRKLARYDSEGKIIFIRRQSTSPSDAITEKHGKAPKKKTKHVSATSTKQRVLRRAWSRIIGVEEDEIGLEDSFFQLGGDSIGAMKLVSELRGGGSGGGQGLELTVAEIFKHRTLYGMADVCREVKKANDQGKIVAGDDNTATAAAPAPVPFSLLDVGDKDTFLHEIVEPAIVVAQTSPTRILDVLPARPLQHIAVRGTTQIPRFSSRYELFHFTGPVNREHLFNACNELVSRNEILRTVFIEHERQCYGVVLEHLDVAIDEYDVDGSVDEFARKLCDLDVQVKLPLGASFVKFFFIRGGGGGGGGGGDAVESSSCLALRVSHAQYDEICLVGLIRQFGALYESQQQAQQDGNQAVTIPTFIPFSQFVYHTVNTCIPRSIPYWTDLLRGAKLSVLRPGNLPPLKTRIPGDMTRTIDISARSRDITTATLPTAAWALCLARRLRVRDVTFGEVVSGRNTDLPHAAGSGVVVGADSVLGPTWQYIPVRVRFGGDDGEKDGGSWTGADLLEHVQHQHVASAEHQGMGLCEIIRAGCFGDDDDGFHHHHQHGNDSSGNDGSLRSYQEGHGCGGGSGSADEYWFDTVVHQDVYHVEEMHFGGNNHDSHNNGGSSGSGSSSAVECKMETVYPHYEPLREWKIQAFVGKDGDSLTFEVVTFRDWLPVARELLDELEGIMEELIMRPGDVLVL